MRSLKSLVLVGFMMAVGAPAFAAAGHAGTHPGATDVKKTTEKKETTVEKTTEKTEAHKCDKTGAMCKEGADCKPEHCTGHPQH